MVKVAVHARTEIHSLHHAASGQDAQQRVKILEAIHFRHVEGVRQGFGRIRVDLHTLMRKRKQSIDTLYPPQVT